MIRSSSPEESEKLPMVWYDGKTTSKIEIILYKLFLCSRSLTVVYSLHLEVGEQEVLVETPWFITYFSLPLSLVLLRWLISNLLQDISCCSVFQATSSRRAFLFTQIAFASSKWHKVKGIVD